MIDITKQAESCVLFPEALARAPAQYFQQITPLARWAVFFGP
jgi:hypothetical protein